MLKQAILLAVLGWLQIGCTIYAERVEGMEALSSPGEYRVEEHVYARYGKDQLTGDLFLPEHRQKGALLPVVLVIHGGGWARGKRQQMTSHCIRLVKRGFAVFNVSYRFAPAHIWPSQMDDMENALAWIGKNAGRYGFDLNRIGAYGYSAGAHLALMLAFHPNRDKPGALKIAAVAGGGSPVDLTMWPKGELVVQLIGHPYKTHARLYREASPLFHVRPGLPPTYLYHGKYDWIVDVKQSHMMVEALKKKGLSVEYDEKFFGHITTFLFDEEEMQAVGDFFIRKLKGQTISAHHH